MLNMIIRDRVGNGRGYHNPHSRLSSRIFCKLYPDHPTQKNFRIIDSNISGIRLARCDVGGMPIPEQNRKTNLVEWTINMIKCAMGKAEISELWAFKPIWIFAPYLDNISKWAFLLHMWKSWILDVMYFLPHLPLILLYLFVLNP